MLELADILRFGGIVLIVFFLFRMQARREQRRRQRERKEASTSPRTSSQGPLAQRSQTTGNLAHNSRGVEQMELELQTTARDILAEIQTKTAILQQLIIDATAATDRLESLLREQRSAEKSSAA